jgi:cell division control protein 6
VNEVVGEVETDSIVAKTYVNCMSINSAQEIYAKLVSDLCDDEVAGNGTMRLQRMFAPHRTATDMYVVILDEVDHLLALDLEILYKLFEWSLQRSSRLILIGIANALDLTDRFLPRLKARNLKPELLPIMPYTAVQIVSIITTRLQSLMPTENTGPAGFVPFIHPAAIQLLSRKVAAQTGDLRKAFDLCRRAIDCIEGETRQKHLDQLIAEDVQASPSKAPLTENSNLSSPISARSPSKGLTRARLTKSLATLNAETAPRASIALIGRITSSTFGNGPAQRLQSLNLQQKAALCALIALEKRKRAAATAKIMTNPSKNANVAPTVAALYSAYCALCKRDSILHPLTSTEFRDVVSSLETMSLVAPVHGKNGSFDVMSTPSKRGRKAFSGTTADEKRFASCVSEKEVEQAVEGLGSGILKAILGGDGLA